jgi:endonuclease/exonuclease/phosphatase (EEP) superfamily protein YafD
MSAGADGKRLPRRALSPGTAAVSIAVAGLLAPGASRVFGDGWLGWASDLAAHWVWLWLPLGLAGLLLVRWPWRVRVATACAMPLLAWWWLPPAMAESPQPAHLRVMVANVHLGRADAAALLAQASDPAVDVIALLELTPAFARSLGSASAWPHRHMLPIDGAFGIGILSRWPLRDARVLKDDAGVPYLRAQVDAPGGAFEVVAVHPIPPIDATKHAMRNRLFAAVRPRGETPALLIGDFNATPWSNAAPLLTANGWRWFGGVQPTWPTSDWGIPIDAVWAHGPWQVTERSVGPSIGSDHRPLRVGLRLTASPP